MNDAKVQPWHSSRDHALLRGNCARAAAAMLDQSAAAVYRDAKERRPPSPAAFLLLQVVLAQS